MLWMIQSVEEMSEEVDGMMEGCENRVRGCV